ncbi:FIST signal transduction protein [Polyangium sorediatum]|uniref:FIST signal transduction protein n=1 Tax=Polyangium sorediatum TaxID=889274 RepID=UPI0010BD5C75|nr:FIST N-terminal domain-containing protein [Polyangium sorediatum]
MRAATVSIVHTDALTAGREVAEELTFELGGPPETVLLFVSSQHDPVQVLAGLRGRLPAGVVVAGCSSFAEINTDEGLTSSVTAMGLRGIECAAFKVDSLLPDSRRAGHALAEKVRGFGPSLLVTFPDGIHGSPGEYVRGLQDVLGATFPIVGGVSAEHLAFERTSQICNREVLTGGAVALAIRGTRAIATAAKSGFRPLGAVRTVTRVEGKNLILELDGKPALRIYKDFLGHAFRDQQMIGIEFPLLVILDFEGSYMDSDERVNVVRVVRKLDEEKGGLLLSSEIAVGMKIRLTCSTRDDLLLAAAQAAEEVHRKMPSPSLALVFGCAGRKLILGTRYQEEIRRAFSALAPGVPKVGFYTYGELCPVRDITLCHDETFTVVLLGA